MDLNKLSLAAANTLTLEEQQQESEFMVEYEAAYQKYHALAAAYEAVIILEDDPRRREVLRGLLDDVHEDNK